MIKIVSMVTICTLDQPLDLLYLSHNIEGTIFPKKMGIWVKYRMKPENYYIAFYKSGKFLITGAKSIEKINNTAQRVLIILENAGVRRNITNIEIVNIVCLGSIHLKTTLESIISNLDSSDASYEPEQFPGLIFKKWDGTFLLFASGKVIITGVRDYQTAKNLLKKFEKLINK
jgi:transcription initiation factor TFIID TATA-box-binding protein